MQRLPLPVPAGERTSMSPWASARIMIFDRLVFRRVSDGVVGQVADRSFNRRAVDAKPDFNRRAEL